MKGIIICAVMGMLILTACNGSSVGTPGTQGDESSAALTADEARSIAEESVCVEKGDIGSTEGYNENSKTWWFTLDPKPEFSSSICSPACVVTEETNAAEINWRCTGALPSTNP